MNSLAGGFNLAMPVVLESIAAGIFHKGKSLRPYRLLVFILLLRAFPWVSWKVEDLRSSKVGITWSEWRWLLRNMPMPKGLSLVLMYLL